MPRVFLERLEMKLAEKKNSLLRWKGNSGGMSYVFFKVGERRRVSPLIFSESEDKPLLRAVTLEILGYELDPITKKLKPATLYLA